MTSNYRYEILKYSVSYCIEDNTDETGIMHISNAELMRPVYDDVCDDSVKCFDDISMATDVYNGQYSKYYSRRYGDIVEITYYILCKVDDTFECQDIILPREDFIYKG